MNLQPYRSPFFSAEALHRAWRDCRRHKRGSPGAIAFEMRLADELKYLEEALSNRKYQPRPSVRFTTRRPKLREIVAADFRDRVVHHLYVRAVVPDWERVFIHDSFACRKGKGTHKAVDRLAFFVRKATRGGQDRAYYLQLDIRSFLMSIDRRILLSRLERRLKIRFGLLVPPLKKGVRGISIQTGCSSLTKSPRPPFSKGEFFNRHYPVDRSLINRAGPRGGTAGFRRQYAWFSGRAFGGILFFQVGKYYELLNEFPSQNWLFQIGRSCTPSAHRKILARSAAMHTTSCGAHLTYLNDLFRNPSFGMETNEQARDFGPLLGLKAIENRPGFWRRCGFHRRYLSRFIRKAAALHLPLTVVRERGRLSAGIKERKIAMRIIPKGSLRDEKGFTP